MLGSSYLFHDDWLDKVRLTLTVTLTLTLTPPLTLALTLNLALTLTLTRCATCSGPSWRRRSLGVRWG